MTTVETTVSLSISEDGLTLEALSDQIGTALQEAGKELLAQACQAVEDRLLEAPGVKRKKRRGRNLLTRFGWMRLTRWQTWHPERGYSHPLDEALRLERAQHASPWVLKQAVALAARLPYRQTTYLLEAFIDEHIDHRTLYRWMQKLGAQIILEEDEQQQAVFRDGVVPERDPTEREIILAEVDGTFLRSQREEGDKFEVRLGILTTGKHLVSSTAKHRRYRLLERVRYGGVETAQDFGERLFLKGEARLGLSHAHHVLLVDEIAAGLVEKEIVELSKLLDDLKRAGQTMIIIEHVLDVMFQHCDRLLVLDFGECVTQGAPEDVSRDQRVIDIYLGTEEGREVEARSPAAAHPRPGRHRPLLTMSGVSAAYGDFQALSDVSLEVHEGEIVALIGQNGAGKTTIIRAITRQMPLLDGDIRFRNESLMEAQPHEIVEQGIAQCFEGRNIFPHMTVRENLDIGAYTKRARPRRRDTLQRVMNLFPILAERENQLGATLSGGEQQMLAIGRALMALPDLIIFDEISLGLAPLVIDHLYEAVREINREGTTVLLVEQNVHRSLSIADQAHIIERGRIVLSGTTNELQRNELVREAYFGL